MDNSVEKLGEGIGSLIHYLMGRGKKDFNEHLQYMLSANNGNMHDTVAAIQKLGPDSKMYKNFIKYTGMQPDPNNFPETDQQVKSRVSRNFVNQALIPTPITDTSNQMYINQDNPNFGAVLDVARDYKGPIGPDQYMSALQMQETARQNQAMKVLEAARQGIFTGIAGGANASVNPINAAITNINPTLFPGSSLKYPDQNQQQAPQPQQAPMPAGGGGIRLMPSIGIQDSQGGLEPVAQALASLASYVSRANAPTSNDGFPTMPGPTTKVQNDTYRTTVNAPRSLANAEKRTESYGKQTDANVDEIRNGKIPLEQARTEQAKASAEYTTKRSQHIAAMENNVARGINSGSLKMDENDKVLLLNTRQVYTQATKTVSYMIANGAGPEQLKTAKAQADRAEAEYYGQLKKIQDKQKAEQPAPSNAPASKSSSTNVRTTTQKQKTPGVSKGVQGM